MVLNRVTFHESAKPLTPCRRSGSFFGPFPGHRSTVALLIAAGTLFCLIFATSTATASPLGKAAKKGRVDEVRRLIDSGVDVDDRDRSGNTALYFAAQKGHAEVVKLLVDAGADVDVDNSFGSTPLHVAARGGHVDAIRALANGGANLDALNLSGANTSDLANRSALQARGMRPSTPLAKAARAGKFEAVKVLIELGAKLPAADAAQQASQKGHEEIAAYIARATGERRSKQLAAKSKVDPFASKNPIDLSAGAGADYGRRVAAIIGISRYDKLNNLEGARGDAREMAKLLRTLGFDEVLELYDKDATRTGILELVGQKLRAKTGPKDLAFVFFAGHGATENLPNGEKRGYLIPTEGSTDDPYVTGISMETVQDLSNRLAARHVYYAIDACYSGSLTQRRPDNEHARGGADKRAVQVLTAGLEGQQAIEVDGRGLFTTYLLEALRGEANLNGDKFVTASEIGQFVTDQVGEVSRGRQTPAYGHLGGTGEITFRIR